ncbi:carbon storage regulator [Anatilimnocola sp. NA78]|uniref:carbon storage regulator n=1 Tax=Anatilimnocola sp. NA78 TaxID=3415683 RepID=UPI003CE5B86B
MLVLTRKLQERICIGNNITVTVLRVKGQQVRIGIEAPRDVRVIRGELPPTANRRLEAENAGPEMSDTDQDSLPLTIDIDASDLLCDSDAEAVEADETNNAVVYGRGRPAAMKQFVRTVLESALAK